MTDGWSLEPTTASDVMAQRYKRRRFAKDPSSELEIDAGMTAFSDENESGWTICVHPEGALYFVRRQKRNEKSEANITILTNADVKDQERCICEHLDNAIDVILAQVIERGLQVDAELVLCPNIKHKTIGYYFVDVQARCMIWAETLKLSETRITENVRGFRSMEHIRYAMEAQYWAHVEAFPLARSFDEKTYNELSHAVLHASAERLTSKTSLSPFDADELDKIRDILDSLQDQLHHESPYAVCILARLSHTFAVSRLHNFCGQPEARLDADKSVWPDNTLSSHWIFLSLSVFMFGTPYSQLERLNNVWVDRTVNSARWKEYISTVYDEFMGLTLYSTVMLTVDVSFLAVPDVEVASLGNEDASTVSTYLSIIAIVGSMTLSLLLSADARRRKSESASKAAGLLNTVNMLFGLELLAIMYSMPFALLMWGMVSFLIGFCCRVFPQAAIYTRCLCAVALLILVMAVGLPLCTWWCVKKLDPADDEALE
ncbi:hypothetical protein CONPUDRAFT_139857 [Coniophora puteana RWD-64-598 SS2]|uniref:Uncharacterized protein n=1 Tax=Coniophora puteana (strain RWD-64-598) TaxID=741705 RepID=A0A5M3MAS5_CONPW|nr:uncharacterized protein CONPUDRAFT_139857 [Coniophora puteana RWD-64-598 SS2]EIW75890.1 hypothetical protein CONPUDRAFT_139857 [Coniophora puteana RWD-64-598 SS2]